MIFWHTITTLGASPITIPIALIITLWLFLNKEKFMAFYWCLLFGCAMILVVATKVAFMGWGYGVESLDFTGISGHATRAAVVFPLLFYFGFQRAPRKVNTLPVYVGVALGIVISVSRVMVNVHSGSEILAGWLLGSAIAWLFVKSMMSHQIYTSRRWMVLCSCVLIFLSPTTKNLHTDGAIATIALKLSGRDHPFSRANWRHHSNEMHFWSYSMGE